MKSAGKYEDMGKEVARQLGSGPGTERRGRQRRAFLALNRATHPMFKKKRLGLMVGTAVATVLVGVVSFLLIEALRPASPVFWVGIERQAGQVGRWIRTDDLAPVPVEFKDGTRLELDRSSAGRVFTREKQVRIELGRGRVTANINREKTESSWTVEAGDFRVTALGTVFSVSRGESSVLEVSVWRGRVGVKGPGLTDQGIRLKEGERLVIGVDGHLAVSSLSGKPGPAVIEDPGAAAEEEPTVVSLATRVEPAKPIPVAPKQEAQVKEVASLEQVKSPGWQDHYQRRDYSQAVAEAEKMGLESLYSTLGDADLWQLSNAARYSGRSEVATQALLSLRKRFRDSWRSAVAAFLLGRLALEAKQDTRTACNWFMVYLKEAPDGRLAEEALGRSMSSCSAAGLDTFARLAARDYLDRYPAGSLATTARSLLSAKGDPVQ